jgi:hypothetical protein
MRLMDIAGLPSSQRAAGEDAAGGLVRERLQSPVNRLSGNHAAGSTGSR